MERRLLDKQDNASSTMWQSNIRILISLKWVRTGNSLKNWLKQVFWELPDSTGTVVDTTDYYSLTDGGMKKYTGDSTSFQVCLIHVLFILYLACFITCETTMTQYYETLTSGNATDRANKLSSIWSFFIDHSSQEIYTTCNAINNSLKSLKKVKGHCWACPTRKLWKLCCGSTSVTCPTDPRDLEGTAPAWASCWCRVPSIFTSLGRGL